MFSKVFKILPAFVVLAAFAAIWTPLPGHTQGRALPSSQEQIKLSFAPVVRSVSPAVVNIYTKRTVSRQQANPFFNDPFFNQFFGNRSSRGGRLRQQVESALGSGVIVDPSGIIITNAHVIKNADEVTAGLSDGREIEARISVIDEASDLAILRLIDPPDDIPVAPLAKNNSLEVGDIVLAIGNPFGVGQTVTSGIVSAQGRSSLNINDFNFFIQTDAAINPGNSGGPLVDLDGRVVGINTAIYSRSGGSLGIGFAIPAEMVHSVLAAERMAEQDGVTLDRIQRAWLGISAQNVTSDIAESLDLEAVRGVLIAGLHPTSPLKRAGLKTGDVVIRMGERDIQDASEMKFRMATVPLGDSITVEALRQGKTFTFRVKSILPPDEPARNTTELSGEHILNGVTIANLNPAVSEELDLGALITAKDKVVVTDIKRRSALRFVRTGDLILEINGREIKDVDDVKRAIKRYDGRGWKLITERDGQVQQVIIR